MISVSVATAIFLYVVLALWGIFMLWIWFERGEGAKARPLVRRVIWECEICAYTYVDSTHDTISRCPQCHSFNERKDPEE